MRKRATVFFTGRVQGVGFRYTALEIACGYELTGYVRNLDDGRVEVYAVGTEAKLSQLAGMLHKGPMWADVRGVEEQEAAEHQYGGFRIEARRGAGHRG